MSARVVFLDRDGVINKDSKDYITSWSRFEFLPGSIKAISLLVKKGFLIIIITNQSAVNRGLMSIETLCDMHERMKKALGNAGAEITDIFFCPHTPYQDCSCRKPKTGMVEAAVQKYRIDLSSSYLIGDSPKDIICGRDAGVGSTILVKSGLSDDAEEILKKDGISWNYTATDLLEATRYILLREESDG